MEGDSKKPATLGDIPGTSPRRHAATLAKEARTDEIGKDEEVKSTLGLGLEKPSFEVGKPIVPIQFLKVAPPSSIDCT